jgi:hypothetical protein
VVGASRLPVSRSHVFAISRCRCLRKRRLPPSAIGRQNRWQQSCGHVISHWSQLKIKMDAGRGHEHVRQRPKRSQSPAWRRTAEGKLVLPKAPSSEDEEWDEVDRAERAQRLRHVASLGVVGWGWALAFHTCAAPVVDPLAAAGGRWVLLSSWALLVSAMFWAGKAFLSWAPDAPLAEHLAPLVELGWPLCFGTSTFAALLLLFVLLSGCLSDFDITASWICPAPLDGAPVAWWRVSPWLQLLATNVLPAALVYLEAVVPSVPPTPPGTVPDAARRQTSHRLIVGGICGLLAYTVLNYRRSGRWAYPLGQGELNFWLSAPLMAHCWWSHCLLAEANLSAGILWRRLLLPPLILGALGLVVGCTGLMLHFVITDAKDLASSSRWGR